MAIPARTFGVAWGKHVLMETRREQIKRVAARLFVERGVGGTSVRDIADGVGLLSGSLYHHFASKDAIAFAILDDFIRDLNALYASVLPHVSGMREELRALLYSSIEVAEKHPYATEIYQNELAYHGPQAPEEIADGVRRANQFWLDAATRARDSGQLRGGLDPEEFSRMVRESVWWSVRQHREALAERGTTIADTLLTVFLDGAAVTAAGSSPSGTDARTGSPSAAAPSGEGRIPAAGPTELERRLLALESKVAALESRPLI